MIEKEISETYSYNPNDFNERGRRVSDGLSFRKLIEEFEIDFHRLHSTEYAANLYGNSKTMMLLERACDAAPFMMYGMDNANCTLHPPSILSALIILRAESRSM